MKELNQLCRQGRLYDVERWIRAGKPLQIGPNVEARGRFRSALEIALDTGQHSLCWLLLSNGYELGLERTSPFDVALKRRRWDLVDLLFEFRADPNQVSLTTLFDTYQLELFERFHSAGVDLTKEHALADALAFHPGNKPLFGFVKRRRLEHQGIQRELDMALGYHVREGNEKGIMLSLWAGADPQVPVPDLEYGSEHDPEEFESAVEQAADRGNVRALRRFKPDPARIDFDRLYGRASSREVVKLLAEIRLPHSIVDVLHRLCCFSGLRWDRQVDWKGAFLAILDCGVRWETAEKSALAGIRFDLLKVPDWQLHDILLALRRSEVCAPEIFQELTRTQAMQKRMLELKLVKPYVKPISKAEQRRRDVVRFASRYNREELYSRVWSQPVSKVAESYGVSGSYLARVCRVLCVPVPPRGYWARSRSGRRVRRPKLPVLRS